MPAFHDLTGTRFGRLLVTGIAQRGGNHLWQCICDCGRIEDVRNSQLKAHGITACRACRQPDCVVCSKRVPLERGNRNTCSDACARIKRSAIDAEQNARKNAEDPGRHRRRYAAKKADPERYARMQEYMRAHDRARWAEVRADPEKWAAVRARNNAWYTANAERVQAERRARLDAMDAATYAVWADRMRAYGRAYRSRWREHLHQHPEMHRQYLDRLAEWRRQSALRGLLGVADQMMERYDDDDQS